MRLDHVQPTVVGNGPCAPASTGHGPVLRHLPTPAKTCRDSCRHLPETFPDTGECLMGCVGCVHATVSVQCHAWAALHHLLDTCQKFSSPKLCRRTYTENQCGLKHQMNQTDDVWTRPEPVDKCGQLQFRHCHHRGRRAFNLGHEATDTGLAYAPVSQAHGHHHSVQCFVLLHCSADQFGATPGGF